MTTKPAYLSQVLSPGSVVSASPGDYLRIILPSGKVVSLRVDSDQVTVCLGTLDLAASGFKIPNGYLYGQLFGESLLGGEWVIDMG